MRTIYIITYVEKVIARWREGYGTVVPPELKNRERTFVEMYSALGYDFTSLNWVKTSHLT